MGAFSRSQATDILDQGLAVRMGNGTVDINPDLIDPVDEFAVQGVQQLLFHDMLLPTEQQVRSLGPSTHLAYLPILLTCKG